MTVMEYVGTRLVKARERINYPLPEEIREARKTVGMTIAEAAELVGVHKKTWICWEIPKGEKGHQCMLPCYAELFAYKSGLKPLPEIVRKINEKRKD